MQDSQLFVYTSASTWERTIQSRAHLDPRGDRSGQISESEVEPSSAVTLQQGKVALTDSSVRGGFQRRIRDTLISSRSARTDKVRVEFLRLGTSRTIQWSAARSEIALICVRGKVGNMYLTSPGQAESAAPGTANFWFFPEGVGAQGELTSKGVYDCAGIFVDPSFLSLTAKRDLTEPVAGFANEAFLRAFDLLADEMTGAGELLPLFAEGWAMQALAHVARAARPHSQTSAPLKGSLAPWQLRRATEMLRSDLCEDLGLQRVAEACRLSCSHFARAFKTSTGLPPHRWLMRERIERAQDLLMRSPFPLTEIALMCGFSDHSHFSRVFRVIRGVSPGAWRREHHVATPEPGLRERAVL